MKVKTFMECMDGDNFLFLIHLRRETEEETTEQLIKIAEEVNMDYVELDKTIEVPNGLLCFFKVEERKRPHVFRELYNAHDKLMGGKKQYANNVQRLSPL